MSARPPLTRSLRLLLLSMGLAFCLFPQQSSHGQAADVSLAAEPTVAVVSVMVELTGPSAAEVYAAQDVNAASADTLAAVTQAQIADLTAAQDALLTTLATFDAQPLYQLQRVYNGIAVRLPADQMAAVAALPGVKAVHQLVAKAPANDGVVTEIGAPQVWPTGIAGLTGDGVTVAIIDTGIDYLHRNFGGPGSGYADNDPTVIGDVLNFPGGKVVGGYDFAGDTYNASAGSFAYQPVPVPDPDPADCYGVGHGSHVAGTIGGYGVTPAGETYAGPYTSAVDLTQFRVAPGVAPHAQLLSLKVFGCSGSSEIVDMAVEWAVDPNQDGDFRDRVDVINMSLGAGFGATYDSTAMAVENAAKTGVIVVAAMGNQGDLVYAAGSPGIADHAIAVAAGTLPNTTTPAGIAGFSSRGPRRGDGVLKPDIAAPGVDVRSTRQGTGTDGVSLSGTSMASAVAAGAMALVRQAHPAPGWRAEELKALVMNTAVTPLVDDGAHSYGPTRAGAGRIDLPRALASDLIAYDAQTPALVTLSFGLPEVLDTHTAVRSLRVVNKGASPISVTVAYSEVNSMAGVTVAVDVGRVLTVPAHSAVSLPVTLTAVADRMASQPDATRDATDVSLTEVGGYVRLIPFAEGAPTIQTPVYAAPRRVGWLELDGQALDFGEALTSTTVLTLTGSLPDGSYPPTETVALMGFFALQHTSAPITEGPDGDAPDERYAFADLQYVGVAGPLDGKLYFGIATYGPWSSPHEVLFAIELDVDGDGVGDYLLANRDRAYLSIFSTTGVDDYIGVLEQDNSTDRRDQGALNGYDANVYDTRLFNNDVMVIPLRIADLGTGVTRVRYRVATYTIDVSNATELDRAVDRTGWRTLDLTQPNGLSISGWTQAVVPASSAPTVTVTFDREAAAPAGVRGLLMLQWQNSAGRRAQAFPLRYTWPAALHLPLLTQP